LSAYKLSSGPERAQIMIVGDAPESEDLRLGKPFAGPAGRLLRNFLLEAGIDAEDCYLTYLCPAFPPGGMFHRFFIDGGLPMAPVAEGLEALRLDIERIRPNVLLALGNFPLALLTSKGRWIDQWKDGKHSRGYTGIQDWRGSILHCSLAEAKLIPTFHPAYIAREGMPDHGIFKVDLARAAREAGFPEVRRPEKAIYLASETPQVLANYCGVIDRDEAPEWQMAEITREEIRETLLSTPEVPTTLDIEYIGSKLLCCGLTNCRDKAYVLPTTNLNDQMYLESIVRETRQFNAQNSMFDASILEWHYNLPIMDRVTFDTMVAAHAANIELPKGLDFLVSVYTDQPYYKGMVNWKLIKKGLQPASVVYAYNGIDVWTQHEVMEKQKVLELTDPAVQRTYEFMMKLLPPLWEMSKRGIKIDAELREEVRRELRAEEVAGGFELALLLGLSHAPNVKSGPQMSEILFSRLGLKPGKLNKTGPATDDKTLAALSLAAKTDDQREALRLIRQVRKARDLQSKFFNLEFDTDGRMRGHYDPTKTVTGRLASRKFYPTGLGTNQQNIPRDKRARRVFVADRKKIFAYADLEKAESFVVAQISGDARMLFDHSPGQNAHRNLGSALFNIPPEALDEDQYYLSKKTRHAGNYMQGWMTFMRNVNQDAHKTGVAIDAKQAKFFIQTYKDLHPGLPRWWRETETRLYATRTLSNLLGRHRVFYGHIGGLLPEAIAFVPQSTVGDTLDEGFLALHGVETPYIRERELWKNYEGIAEELKEYGFEALQQVHDSVGFQCWEKDAERVFPLVRRALSIPLTNPRTYEEFTIAVEIQADLDPERFAAGKSNWGDCKVWKEGV
jgi:uracil-DNA glycosylase family 4